MKKIKGEEEVETFSIIKQQGNLPVKLEELVPLSFIGPAAVTFYRQRIMLMNVLEVTEQQRKATLRDAQDVAGMLLDIEAKIGKLLPSPEEARKLEGATKGKVGGTKVLPTTYY
jgi:hypothetical protein